MHGIALGTNLRTRRKSKVIDKSYQSRRADVFGHNGLTPGDWFPVQLCALFRGAHGAPQAGIYADARGAYSVVVSGMYSTLDRDKGNSLLYSSSCSHNNKDKWQPTPSTRGTRTLELAIQTGNPVRVLRAKAAESRYAPMEGIRYNGLYHVVEKRLPQKAHKGRYEQFELQRVQGQPVSLEQCRIRPNANEMRDFYSIDNPYPARC